MNQKFSLFSDLTVKKLKELKPVKRKTLVEEPNLEIYKISSQP